MDKVQIGPQPLMYPMPAALVGAKVGGKPNFMTAAWVGVACMAPPMLCVAINHQRHTLKGIEENGTFSINVPSAQQMVETDYCGMVGGASVDKSQVFDVFYGKLKTAPMARQCPVNIECRVFQKVDCGSHVLVIGEVAEIFVMKSMPSGGAPDIAKVDPLIYSGGKYYSVGEQIGTAWTAGKTYRKK